MGKRQKLVIIGGAVFITAIAAGSALWLSTQDGRFRPLIEAERYELFSLDPASFDDKATIPGYFRNYKILGSTVVSDAKVRETLNTALIDGVKYGSEPAKCFKPRHAIRITKSGVVTDYLICFECSQIHVFRGPTTTELWKVSKSPEAVFDKSLKDAGVPLAEKTEKPK